MEGREIFGLLTAILVLAGITFAITNAKGTAAIMESGAKSYAGLVNAATGRI